MLTQTRVTDSQLRHASSKEISGAQPRRIPRLVNFILLFSLILAIVILGVMAVARMGALPQILDPPQAYLPGNPSPRELLCHEISYGYPLCSVDHLGQNIYVNYDTDTELITRTIIMAQTYSIGQLVVAWGTPTGMVWKYDRVRVYWGIRSALVPSRSFKPESPVEYILYDLSEPEIASWRGFERRRHE